MLSDDFPEFAGGERRAARPGASTPVSLHLQVPDCDRLFQQALAAGATVKMPLADMFWGDRFGKLSDPFGHEWSVATRQRELSPAEMQAAMRQAFAKS